MWQAETVAQLLRSLGHTTQIIAVKSKGDLDLSKPLHELGTTGIFTKVLDDALFANEVDIAVHSLKDYPTVPPKGIVLGAHLKREDPMDLLIPKGEIDWYDHEDSVTTIGTGSIRRKAQWLHKFPNHQLDNLRGNVQTRMKKLEENEWSGIIMASAGLRRMEAVPENAIALNWMIPAPAQGVIGITLREDDEAASKACALLDVKTSRITSTVERMFLNTLEGGCSAPIGALARISANQLYFAGCLHSLDGSEEVRIENQVPLSEWKDAGRIFAQEVKQKGGDKILGALK